ncbi:MAG: FAD-dependent oxidoreductase [Parachlamydiaceae bacterium]
MNNHLTKQTLTLFLFLFSWSLIYLEAREGIHDICPLKMTPCIPTELQNLPYAIYPANVEYNTARLIFNRRFVYFPKAIIMPRTFQEAQETLLTLKKYHLNFSVRSGGHCFEPGSLSSDYVLDLQNFNSITPNMSDETVYIGAGCRLENVIQTLGMIDRAIPTGTCPTVGIAGLTLGGGIGLLIRQFGLTCDSVKSITFLKADGRIIEVDALHDPDLFWALLGAGNGSYGIVLGFTFFMHNIPEVTFYELTWEWDPTLISPIMHAWQSWVKKIPDTVSSVIGIRHPNEICSHPDEAPPLVIRIYGLKVGSEPFTEWKKSFQDLNPHVKILTGRYLDLSRYWIAQPALPFNKAKSRILMKPMSDETIKQITHFFTKLEKKDPNYLVYFNFEVFGGVLSKFNTSFFPRNAFGWWFQAYFWDDQSQSEEVLNLSRQFYSAIPPEVSKYCYANIVDYDLGKGYLKRYYGNHVERLIKIKNQYDPSNLFHWKQSIPNTCKKGVHCVVDN